MIQITKYKNKIQIKGHSMPDICASVSSVVYTWVNMVKTVIDENAIDFEDNTKEDYILITIKSRKKSIKQSIFVLLSMFVDIQGQAPNGEVEVRILDE